MTQPESLRLADLLEQIDGRHWQVQDSAAAELRRLHALIAACEPYLKEGETPAERIERERKDVGGALRLLAREKHKTEALLEALKEIEPILARMYGLQASELPPMQMVRAAIASVEGEKA